MKMNNLLRETKKGSVFGYAVLVVVLLVIAGLFIINPFNHPDQLSLYGQPSLSNSFEVTPIDAKASVSAEIVNKDGVTYELLCNEKEEIIKVPVYINNTINWLDKNITGCKDIVEANLTSFCKKSYTYKDLNDYEDKIIKVCIKSGSVKVNDKIISHSRYFCGAEVCDEKYDASGGMGDSNGDGICQKGETCINYEELL